MTRAALYKNAAHLSAYRRGVQAAKDGKPRTSPYSAVNQVAAYFCRAWLSGYDSVKQPC